MPTIAPVLSPDFASLTTIADALPVSVPVAAAGVPVSVPVAAAGVPVPVPVATAGIPVLPVRPTTVVAEGPTVTVTCASFVVVVVRVVVAVGGLRLVDRVCTLQLGSGVAHVAH
jgi:hypothetical protein